MKTSLTKKPFILATSGVLLVLVIFSWEFYHLSTWSSKAYRANDHSLRETNQELPSQATNNQNKTSKDEGRMVKLAPGMSLKALSKSLKSSGSIDSAKKFYFWIRLTGQYPHFQAGTYFFPKPISPSQISTAMKAGKTHTQVTLELTIPEGFTLEQINRRLAKHQVATFSDLQALSRDKRFVAKLGLKSPDLEGFLYPASYRFFHEFPSPRDVYTKMTQEFFKRLPKSYHTQAQSHGLSLREAVTIASLIEKETLLDDEKALISEVIWNRLKKKMPLGIDASLIYGIKNYDGNITFNHLKDRNNPYNSRIHRGLPPGPIGAPGASSLRAVFTPSNKGVYYYVLLPNGESRHHFSKTLKEHNIYVERLVNSYKRKKNPNTISNPK